MFRKATQVAVVEPRPLAVTDLAWLERNFSFAWDWSAHDNVKRYIKNAWTGAMTRRPDHFIEMFYKGKSLVAGAYHHDQQDMGASCGRIVRELMDEWHEAKKRDDTNLLPLQRAIAAAIVFRVGAAHREDMIDLMLTMDIDPLFGLVGAVILAELRTSRPGLTRKEMLAFKQSLLTSLRDCSPSVGEALKILECKLGNDL